VEARQHWEQVYRTKRPTEVSWYAPHLDVSLRMIEEAAPERASRIIDVGGGEATLVDDLLERGYSYVSVLDVSATALDVAKARLGKCAGKIDWLCGDVTTYPLRAIGTTCGTTVRYSTSAPTRRTAPRMSYRWPAPLSLEGTLSLPLSGQRDRRGVAA